MAILSPNKEDTGLEEGWFRLKEESRCRGKEVMILSLNEGRAWRKGKEVVILAPNKERHRCKEKETVALAPSEGSNRRRGNRWWFLLWGKRLGRRGKEMVMLFPSKERAILEHRRWCVCSHLRNRLRKSRANEKLMSRVWQKVILAHNYRRDWRFGIEADKPIPYICNLERQTNTQEPIGTRGYGIKK